MLRLGNETQLRLIFQVLVLLGPGALDLSLALNVAIRAENRE